MHIKYGIVALALLFFSSYAFGQKDDNCLHRVVIDAGHGGKDPGAVSRDQKTYEKNLVLSIAMMLGKKIEEEYKDDVIVLYTRTTDVFVPLQDRADFANRNDADLFISVHINASPKGRTGSGHSVHILGASSNPNRDVVSGNLDVCKRENSVILLEDDFTTTYQGFDPSDEASYIFMTLMQGAFYEQSIYFASLVEKSLANTPITNANGVYQNAFYVLWKTAMPAVLLELGYISDDKDLALLKTEEGREKIAQKVFTAFKQYKKNYDESMMLSQEQ